MLNNGYEASENNSEQEDELKQEIQEYKEEKEKVENLGCTIPSIIVFLLLGAIWGSAFSFIKLSVDPKVGFSAFTVVFMRLIIGGLFLLIFFIIELIRSKEFRKQVNQTRGIRNILLMMVLGFFNNAVPFVFVAFAEQSINSGIASILDSSIPLFSMVISHFALKGERITLLKFFGLVIGFAGVILVCLEQVIAGETIDTTQIIGYVIVTLAAASYGIAGVIAKKYLNHVPGLFVSCGQIFSAAIFALLGVLFYDLGIDSRHLSFFKHANYVSWLSVAYLGVLSTGVAYICFFYLIRTVGSVKQSMVGYLLPVFGVIEGAVFLNEWEGIPFYIPIIEVVGCVLIFAGIAVVSFPSWQQMKSGAKKLATSSKREKDLEQAIMESPENVETTESSSLINKVNYDKTTTIQ